MQLQSKIKWLLLIFLIPAFITPVIFLKRYSILYHYYLWQLNHTGHGSEMMTLTENIESIAPYIVPALLETYSDINAPAKGRHGAAIGLISADKEKAENLFIQFLENEDEEILGSAIFELKVARSEKAYKKILNFRDHPNPEVRSQVASYLGRVKNEQSIKTLENILRNDTDEGVRLSAYFSLQELGKIPKK
ncbi:MAG: hypothetical protein A2052_04685 [Deltaproteobacteria bacterium GWA2_54_12]|nr:MAG: hypothetical protein A2052_04685 [Deltaproteobacteria bacterium GWA2_54_12]